MDLSVARGALALTRLRAPLLASLTVALCGLGGVSAQASDLARPTARIVGGHVASTPAPGQALIVTTTARGSFLCGGTLVAARFVVTAAHCVTGSTGRKLLSRQVRIVLGQSDVRRLTDADVYQVSAVYRKANFSQRTFSNDIAVLRLARPATQQPTRVITPEESALARGGQSATIIGWGTTRYGRKSVASRLREAQVPINSRGACRSALGDLYRPSSMICAGRPGGADTCQGDSGGPLLLSDPRGWAGDRLLAGVVSFGVGCGGSTPGVYTRLSDRGISSWLARYVPTVNAKVVGAVVVGQPLTITTETINPRGYTAYTWDLNGDGLYGDAEGPAVAFTPTAARTQVSVQAANATGDREQDHLVLTAQ